MNCQFVLFRFYLNFYNHSVISRQCLDVAGSSMLTFKSAALLKYQSPETSHDILLVTLYQHQAGLHAEHQAKEHLLPF